MPQPYLDIISSASAAAISIERGILRPSSISSKFFRVMLRSTYLTRLSCSHLPPVKCLQDRMISSESAM